MLIISFDFFNNDNCLIEAFYPFSGDFIFIKISEGKYLIIRNNFNFTIKFNNSNFVLKHNF